MKKILLIVPILALSMGAFALDLKKTKEIKSCTVTVEKTVESVEECPGGVTITVSVTKSSTVTSSDCTTAFNSASFNAQANAVTELMDILETKNYICP